jgi:hypothetical protein
VAGKLTGSNIKSTGPGISVCKFFTLLQPRQKKVEAFQSQTRPDLAWRGLKIDKTLLTNGTNK